MTIMAAADDDDVQLSLGKERKGKEKPTISFSVLFAVCDSAAPCRANRKQNN